MSRLVSLVVGSLLVPALALPTSARAGAEPTERREAVVRDARGDALGPRPLRPFADLRRARYTLPASTTGRMRMAVTFEKLGVARDDGRPLRQTVNVLISTGRATYRVSVNHGAETRGRILRTDTWRFRRVRPDHFRVRAVPGEGGVLVATASTEWIRGTSLTFQVLGQAGGSGQAWDVVDESRPLAVPGDEQ